jgi:dienelactone hydrolase
LTEAGGRGVRTPMGMDNTGNGSLGRPSGPGKRPAVIHRHERTGIFQHTTGLAPKPVDAGHVTLVPDPFSQCTGDRQALARGDSRAALAAEEVLQHVDSRVTSLHPLPDVDGRRTALSGVCQTGRRPLLLAACRDDLAAIVIVYGAIYSPDWEP